MTTVFTLLVLGMLTFAQTGTFLPFIGKGAKLVAVAPQAPPAGTLGLASVFGWPRERALAAARTFGASWLYDWGTTPAGDSRIEGVPMIWGKFDGKPPEVGGNSRWLLGFNEPDLAGQADITPEAAALMWRQIEQAYPQKLLVSPAPSHLHPEWLVQFRDAYHARYGRYPRLNALAAHCYDAADNCIRVVEQYVAWAEAWGAKGVWVTEFAYLPACDPAAEAQARKFLAYLARQPKVVRYSPFIAHTDSNINWTFTDESGNPSLFQDDLKSLSCVGRWYAR